MGAHLMGELRFFPGVVAKQALRQREDRLAEAASVLDELDAQAEVQRGLTVGNWPNARAYICTEMELRLAALRELLGAA
jgi:hypothetical protein